MKSLLPSLTANGAFGAMALQKASILFGEKEKRGQRLGRILAVSFTGKKQGIGASLKITYNIIRTVILLVSVDVSLS